MSDLKKNSPDEPEQLQHQMAEIRLRWHEDVEEFVKSMRRATSWRHHVRRHPWLSVAGAAALGYLAVPQKLMVMSPDAKQLEKLAKKERIVVTSNPKDHAKRGVGSMVMALLSGAVVRGITATIGKYAAGILDGKPMAADGSTAQPAGQEATS